MGSKSLGRSEYKARETTIKDELREKINEEKITVNDKISGSKTAGSLELSGTSDAAERIKASVESAGKAIDQQIDRQHNEHQRIAERGNREEQSIDRAATTAMNDSKRSDQTATLIKTEGGAKAFKEAGNAAKEDADWLKRMEQLRKNTRERSESDSRGNTDRTKGTSFTTRR